MKGIHAYIVWIHGHVRNLLPYSENYHVILPEFTLRHYEYINMGRNSFLTVWIHGNRARIHSPSFEFSVALGKFIPAVMNSSRSREFTDFEWEFPVRSKWIHIGSLQVHIDEKEFIFCCMNSSCFQVNSGYCKRIHCHTKEFILQHVNFHQPWDEFSLSLWGFMNPEGIHLSKREFVK